MNVDDSSPSAVKRQITPISPVVLAQWLASGRPMFLLDVREPVGMRGSERSIPRSITIPVHQLFLRKKELPPNKDTGVVVFSTVEDRARAAAFTLSMLGYTNVRVLEGGIDAWAKSGLPIA